MKKLKVRNILHSKQEKEFGPTSDSHFYAPYIGHHQSLIILDLLERLKPKKCFEWGSGWSTVFFPRFFPSTEWISIEHLPYYAKLLEPYLPPNARIIERAIWENYVSEATNWVNDELFDFVFIDGERREDCLNMTLQILRKGGIIIRHDAPGIDYPVVINGKDIREGFEEHNVVAGLWWGRK